MFVCVFLCLLNVGICWCSPAFVCVLDIIAREFLREKTTKLLHVPEEGKKSGLRGGNRALGGNLRLRESCDLFALVLEFPQDWEQACGW